MEYFRLLACFENRQHIGAQGKPCKLIHLQNLEKWIHLTSHASAGTM